MAPQPCNERVGKSTVTWACSLPTGHDGPCYASEAPGERRRWEKAQADQREAAATLAQFQGKAETTAERYTDNATPVPVSAGRRSLHRQCDPWECYVYDGQGHGRRSANDECHIYTGALVPEVAAEVAAQVDEGLDTVVEPTKQRDGDQVLPDGTGACVQDLVIAAMEESKRVGVERYGQTLRTFNGRRGFEDVHDEVRDLFVYLTQIKAEAEADRAELNRVVAAALQTHSYGSDFQAAAAIAVDRVMGWVVGRLNGIADPT